MTLGVSLFTISVVLQVTHPMPMGTELGLKWCEKCHCLFQQSQKLQIQTILVILDYLCMSVTPTTPRS